MADNTQYRICLSLKQVIQSDCLIKNATVFIVFYLEKDPTFFYSMEECEKAYHSLKSFGLKRAMSIRKQLDGKLPTDTAGQKKEDKVDASEVTAF